MLNKTGRAVALQFLTIAVGIGVLLVVSRVYPVADLVRWLRDNVVRHEPWSVVAYPFVHAACNLLLLPAGILVVGSGFLFGLWRGFLLALAGHLIGASGAFWISRTFGRRWIERHLANRPQWQALDAAVAREGWKIVFLTQLSPLFPTSLFNYCYGLTRLRFWPCLLCIAVGWSPGMFVYAYVGRLGSFGWKMWQEGNRPTSVQSAVWLGGLGLSLAVTILLGTLAARLVREARDRAVVKGAGLEGSGVERAAEGELAAAEPAASTRVDRG